MPETLVVNCRGCGEVIPNGHACLMRPGDGAAFHFGCENKPRTFYKVSHGGTSCTWPTREEAEADVEENGDHFFEGTAADWKIEEVTMSWSEFYALGEHQGW